MFLISIDEWMKATYSRIYSRSDALKALDKAIADAGTINHEVDQSHFIFMTGGRLTASDKNSIAIGEKKRALALEAVRKAFDEWAAAQTSKGQNWRDSGRNSSGAVTRLFEQLKYFGNKYLSESDQASIAVIVKNRSQMIPLLFDGCTCVLKADRGRVEALTDQLRKAKAAKRVGQIAKKSYTLASSPATATSSSGGTAAGSEVLTKVNAMIPDIVSNAFGTTLEQLSWEAGETFFKETLTEALNAIKEEILAIMPIAGAVVSSATLVVNTIKLVQSGLATSTLLNLTNKLEESDSKVALTRIRDWQLRDIALRSSKVARSGANTAAQLVAIFTAGAGTAPQVILGICNAIVALLEMVAEMGMQYKESRALTKYLNSTAAGKLGKDIFTASPLAAAYYLLNTPTSDIALQLVNIGDPGWMQEVEQLRQSGPLATVITESERLIDASRYVLVAKGQMRFREREGKEMLVRAKEFVGMEPLRGKTVMKGSGGDSRLSRSTERVGDSSRD